MTSTMLCAASASLARPTPTRSGSREGTLAASSPCRAHLTVLDERDLAEIQCARREPPPGLATVERGGRNLRRMLEGRNIHATRWRDPTGKGRQGMREDGRLAAATNGGNREREEERSHGERSAQPLRTRGARCSGARPPAGDSGPAGPG